MAIEYSLKWYIKGNTTNPPPNPTQFNYLDPPPLQNNPLKRKLRLVFAGIEFL